MGSATFRGSKRPSLGVELELQLIDGRTLGLTGAIDRVLSQIPGSIRDAVKPEFHSCCVEINTGICADVPEVGHDLAPKLAAVAEAAGRQGVLLGWGGTHPFSHWRDQSIVDSPRYHQLAMLYRETLCRQVTFGLHVHVGVRDGDSVVGIANRIAEYLPALLALSVNSPFWCGRPTGLLSHRVEVMAVSPTGGVPPQVAGWDAYVEMVDNLAEIGVIDSAKDLWWDVRPSPEFGTLEVRMCDMPADLPTVLSLTALIQCLVVGLAHSSAPRLDDHASQIVIRQNRWRAARFGLDAELIDPRTRCRSTARERVIDLADRLEGVAHQLGCARQLEHVRAMAHGSTGAERQLQVFGRTGNLVDVVRRQIIPASAYAPSAGSTQVVAAAQLAGAQGPTPALRANWTSTANLPMP